MTSSPHLASPLWSPSDEQKRATSLHRFLAYTGFSSYKDLYQFSVTDLEKFWNHIWDFCQVISPQKGKTIIQDVESVENAVFFPEATLNYAENLLRHRGSTVAIEFFNEQGEYYSLTYDELYDHVSKVVLQLKQWEVGPGTIVAGYLPNIPQTVIAMLATASLGATWSSCSPDFGVSGVIDRFGQIHPSVLFIADGYFYHGKTFDCLEKLPDIQKGLPSVKHVVVIPYVHKEKKMCPEGIICYDDILNRPSSDSDISFVQVPFNHPLYILFSSGTTGVPKCIVHGTGGTLLQHLKEHQLHCDLKKGDKLFYFTTCGWMMWNWQVSALASGATLVLFDGNPMYPSPSILFDWAEKIEITHFGTSAKYIDSLAKLNLVLTQSHRLTKMRMIASTGSPLMPESFEYVYTHIKKDVCLSSISGGTDIVSCFALGNPMAPVWAGELQTPGLGMKIEVYDDETGHPRSSGKGELVCTAPFPSRPVGFWNDPAGTKYHQAYFSHYENIWYHGDYVEMTPHGGVIIYGRSDAVLNPGGVRIGTAEIYRQVEKLPEIIDSIAVGQEWNHDVRVILFVRLQDNVALTQELKDKIKQQIRVNTTPRHVPHKIIQIPDIPRTRNGKIAELAVRDVVHHLPIKNKESLANPDVLVFYENIEELTTE